MLPEEVIQNILCALEGTDWILQKLSTKKKAKMGPGQLWAHPQMRTSYWEHSWMGSCPLSGIRWFFRCWNVHEACGTAACPTLSSGVFQGKKRTCSKYHWAPVYSWCSRAMNSFACYWCNYESAQLFHALWDYHWSILVRLESVISNNDFYGICLISWIVCTGHCSWEIIFQYLRADGV